MKARTEPCELSHSGKNCIASNHRVARLPHIRCHDSSDWRLVSRTRARRDFRSGRGWKHGFEDFYSWWSLHKLTPHERSAHAGADTDPGQVAAVLHSRRLATTQVEFPAKGATCYWSTRPIGQTKHKGDGFRKHRDRSQQSARDGRSAISPPGDQIGSRATNP